MKLLDVRRTVEKVQKHFQLSGAHLDTEVRRKTALSTGMLATDVALNGGIYPSGWYTVSGDEQTGKSTEILHAMISLAASSVPFIDFLEPEGTSTEDYIRAVAKSVLLGIPVAKARNVDVPNLFGKRKLLKSGQPSDQFEIEPRVWYYTDNQVEAIWLSQAAILKRMPNKVYRNGKWWLLFDRTRENMSRLKGKTDARMSKLTDKLAVESMDGGTGQALILIDSLASMIAKSDQEKEDGNNQVGVDAAAHTKHARKVKGLLRDKHATVVATNQMRANINTRYSGGATTQEAGAKYLRFASDVRMQHAAVGIPHAKGFTEKEANVELNEEGRPVGGKDTYRYIRMRTIKNKFGTPWVEVFYRLWESDPTGMCRGFDPVYDTYTYLRDTNQLVGGGPGSPATKMKITLFPEPDAEKGLTIQQVMEEGGGELDSFLPPLKWLDFKKLILLRGTHLKEHCRKLKIRRNPRLRERCFRQVADGFGLAMWNSSRSAKS